jgi:hypothetical protein
MLAQHDFHGFGYLDHHHEVIVIAMFSSLFVRFSASAQQDAIPS